MEPKDDAPSRPHTDVTILDGAVVVNYLKPLAAKTLDDYAVKVLDIVWDQYRENSLKSQTRNKRGKGIRRRVDASTSLPGNWQEFLRINANNIELFAFLVKHITQMVTTKQVVTTNGLEVLCIPSWDTSRLVPCDHEEADTRMILHLADAVNEGFHKNLLPRYSGHRCGCTAFGTAKNFRYMRLLHRLALTSPSLCQFFLCLH